MKDICAVCKQEITEAIPYIVLQEGIVHQGICQTYLEKTINESEDSDLSLTEVQLLH